MSNEKNNVNLFKWLALCAITVGSAYLTFPVKEKVRLGLDLKGGTSFTLGVDYAKLRDRIIESVPEAEKDESVMDAEIARTLDGADDRMIEIIRRRVDAMGTNEPLIQSIKGKHQIVVQLPGVDPKTAEDARDRLEKMAYLEFRLVPENEQELISAIPAGSAPPGYVVSGEGYAKAKDYAEISSTSNYFTRLSMFGVTDTNTRFMLQAAKDRKTGRFLGYYLPRFVNRVSKNDRNRITGNELASATPDQAGTLAGGYCVAFELKRNAAAKFATLTREHIGMQLAIILDGELISSPVIQSEIGRNGQITGDFTLEEAKRLSSDLNAGALPAPLKIDAQSTVDPTVGKDAIDSGITAAAIGFTLVALFMFFYYWYAGVVANIALFLDVILLPAALFLVAHFLGVFVEDPSMAGSVVQLPVLTMPGIAGLVLTLGMAVDANVLIFERVREEFNKGANVGEAVDTGYARAFTAILDSNITTIITGCILYSVGTGPVRGFAIMLTGGVVISMFTALVVTRLVIDYTSNPSARKPFKMMQFFKAPNFDFMKYGKTMFIMSFAIVAIALAVFGYRLATNPGSVLAVDLTGGTSIVFSADGKFETKDVRQVLSSVDNAMVVLKQGEDLYLKTGLVSESADKPSVEATIENTLNASDRFGGVKFKCKSSETVGPTVGADLRESGSKAVMFSLVAILIYIGFRFRFGFGLGGIVALAHDALISLGLFSLCGRQVSLIVITALLTIIGYSINDTVVVFDRIREQLRRDPRASLKEICNVSINACLSRTVITSLTTFFAVAALFIFGDGSIYDFALTMLIGVVAGTYSSVFIATPVMVWFYRGKRPDFEEEKKEQKEA